MGAFGRPFMYKGGISGDVTLTGNLTMSAGKQILADAGTLAAPGIAFAAAPGTGIHNAAGNPTLTRLGAAGLGQFSSGLQPLITMLPQGDLHVQRGLQVDGPAVQTVNYQVTNAHPVVIMNGAGLTATLPATPADNQMVWIKNIDAGTCTIDRNGKTIDGAAANITLASMEAALLHYNGTAWYRLGT